MKRGLAIFALGLMVSLLVAVVFSQFASSQPDGLEYVAGEHGFLDTAQDHALSDLPLADYGGDSTGKLMLAGLVGVLATFGLGYGVFWLAALSGGLGATMSGAHGHALFVHSSSPLHRLAPQVKILSALLMVFAVVTTPREAFWAFGAYAVVLASLTVLAHIPPRFLFSRMLAATPFVLLALLFPIVGSGPRVEVLGLSLSQAGLWDMWNLLAKSLLGLLTAIVLGATTEVADFLRGLSALRVPGLVTSILGFMVRYIDVIVSDLNRMRLALAARGHEASGITQWGPYGRAMGTMFIRTYERGERVYLAMESRGYAGEMPPSSLIKATPLEWALAAVFVTAFWAVAITARGML